MRVGIDVQVVAAGNRSGLYTCLRSVVDAMRPLLADRVWLIADTTSLAPPVPLAQVSEAMGGATVVPLHAPSRVRRLVDRTTVFSRLDVLLHNLHGVMQPSSRAANAYLVPDVIPLAVDYGVPDLTAMYRPFYETAARHGDAILVFSEHARRDFLERVGGSPELVHVAPLAASAQYRPEPDADRLRHALAAYDLASSPYVLMVSTLELRKNHAVLLRAFARLIERDPALPHRLVLVGGRWIGHEAVFELASTLGLKDRLVYLGFAEQLPAIYAGADAFVFPSLYEGFGLPPLEAMASGVPVLAARATSLPEVVGDAGVLFDPHDDERLCEGLHEVLTDRRLHDDLARRGLARAATFSWERTAATYVDAFRSAIARAG